MTAGPDGCAVTSNTMNKDADSSADFATLTLPDGRVVRLPIFKPTVGSEILVDVRTLYSASRVLTFDPGFNSTASCKSGITFIDGDAGLCMYRGYPVHKLIEQNITYPEVCHLLLYGDLPTKLSGQSFTRQLKKEMLMHEQLKKFVETFISNSHPMSILSSVVSAMASFYADPMQAESVEDVTSRELACIRLISKMPSIVAMIYKVQKGQPIVYPRADLTYAENILNMMFGSPVEPYVIDPVKRKAIDAFLIIHGDHEQNASTSTVRTAGSSMANPYACIAAGITSLWGRAHGGANEAVIRMLGEIGTVENIPKFIKQVKDKEVRLMGFGHRIYRNYDPRAHVMNGLCHELFKVTGQKDPLYDIAVALEQVARSDEYFISRNLYPNVDFYSGIVMRALGIPENMFTVFFALGRCAGWLSHWKEMVEEKQMKISRPRQLYLGNKEREISAAPANLEVDSMHTQLGPNTPFHEVQAAIIKGRSI